MTKRFLVSAATVALMAGTGFAYAQGTGMNRDAAGGSTAQQNAPTSSGSANRSNMAEPPSADTHMKSTDIYEKTPREGQHAQGTTQNDRSKSMRSESNESGKSEKNMRAEDRNGKAEDRNQKAEDRNGKAMDHNRSAEDRNGKTTDHNRSAEDRNGMKSNSSRSATDTNRSSTTTTGQAVAGAKLSTEQRTKITTVIKNEHIRPETNINFSISVGTRVPRDGALPSARRPKSSQFTRSWRGYEFIPGSRPDRGRRPPHVRNRGGSRRLIGLAIKRNRGGSLARPM